MLVAKKKVKGTHVTDSTHNNNVLIWKHLIFI